MCHHILSTKHTHILINNMYVQLVCVCVLGDFLHIPLCRIDLCGIMFQHSTPALNWHTHIHIQWWKTTPSLVTVKLVHFVRLFAHTKKRDLMCSDWKQCCRFTCCLTVFSLLELVKDKFINIDWQRLTGQGKGVADWKRRVFQLPAWQNLLLHWSQVKLWVSVSWERTFAPSAGNIRQRWTKHQRLKSFSTLCVFLLGVTTHQ